MPDLRQYGNTQGERPDAYDAERRIIALTITDRESILRALEDCPDGLGDLRAVLLREHEWRVREGLV